MHYAGLERMLLDFYLFCSGRSCSECNWTLLWPGQDYVYSIWTYIPCTWGRWAENGKLSWIVCSSLTVSGHEVYWSTLLRWLWNEWLVTECTSGINIHSSLLNCWQSKNFLLLAHWALEYVVIGVVSIACCSLFWDRAHYDRGTIRIVSMEDTGTFWIYSCFQKIRKKGMSQRIWTNQITVSMHWWRVKGYFLKLHKIQGLWGLRFSSRGTDS